jgi:hypothetical protein
MRSVVRAAAAGVPGAGARVRAGALGCAIALASVAMAAGSKPGRSGWKHYVNARWGFCVDYPKEWKAKFGTDGSGIELHPFPAEDPGRATYISIGGLPDQPQDIDNANIVLDDSPPLDLEGNFARTLGALREYDHASAIRVLEKRKLEFQGYDALETKYLYEAGPSATEWQDQTLWINKEYIIFTASLIGRPEQVRRLEPIYREMVMHRFRLACPAKRSSGR